MLPPAVAAIDMALWDLEGRRTGQPVWRLLGARAAPPVEVNYTVAAADRAGAAGQASAAKAAGFRTVKAKVGIGDDAGRSGRGQGCTRTGHRHQARCQWRVVG